MTTPHPTPRNNAWKVVVPVVVIVLGAVAGLSLVKKFAAHPRVPGQVELAEGATVPDFAMKRFGDGQEIRFSELQADVVLLNFWATWCDACLVEMPSIVALRKKYANQPFGAVLMNVDENPAAVLPGFLQKFGIDFPVYIDPEAKVGSLFGVQGIPLTLLIDMKTRKILMVEGGDRDWNSAEMHGRMDEWLKK